ncbi:MAG: hypothetical protein JXN60_06895 [Lentisphaerae bacterium]|nr:hypothetical protein [Lentisphaerota bacterium]
MIQERMQKKLSAGKPAFGLNLRFHDPAVIAIIGSDLDFVRIDMQHGAIAPNRLSDMIRACDSLGVTSLCRLPNEPEQISLALNADPGGVIVAQIESAKEAEQVVKAAKSSPIDRPYGGGDHHTRDLIEKANKERILILQMESRKAVSNCEAIAAIKGVDGLMLVPDELKLRIDEQLSDSLAKGKLLKIAERVAWASRDQGKLAMYDVGSSLATMKQAAELGFNLISVGSDALCLKKGAEAALAAVREFGRD